MLLVSGFHRWHWAVSLVLALVLSPLAVAADCFESTGNEVTLSGSCTKANTTLFVNGTEQSLNFKLEAKKGGDTVVRKQVKLAIGKCEFTGGITYDNGDTGSIRFSDNDAPKFPAKAKADTTGIVFNSMPNKVATCKPTFEQAKDGYKVSIKYDSAENLPDFKITFENAHIYVPPTDEADWSYKGWRLWTVLGSIVAGLVFVFAIITFIVLKVRKNKEAQLEAGGQTKSKSTAAKSTDKSTAKSKNFLKKNKSKNANKATQPVVDNSEWIRSWVWPTRYTSDVIDTMIMRLDVPNPPIRQLFTLHPMTSEQIAAFNEWARVHNRACAIRGELQLSPELYNRLMAECRVIMAIVYDRLELNQAFMEGPRN
ncbi:hypothetical protein M3Y94_00962800 [Aphelenchoides besseyi]|nr:hypothetical protein M3Y94_00962800 [Aphelenchoides besseyi]KAI6224695.1 hypothetical protein M3Y95_00779700 [Aphelenchoides besseyi]